MNLSISDLVEFSFLEAALDSSVALEQSLLGKQLKANVCQKSVSF